MLLLYHHTNLKISLWNSEIKIFPAPTNLSKNKIFKLVEMSRHLLRNLFLIYFNRIPSSIFLLQNLTLPQSSTLSTHTIDQNRFNRCSTKFWETLLWIQPRSTFISLKSDVATSFQPPLYLHTHQSLFIIVYFTLLRAFVFAVIIGSSIFPLSMPLDWFPFRSLSQSPSSLLELQWEQTWSNPFTLALLEVGLTGNV